MCVYIGLCVYVCVYVCVCECVLMSCLPTQTPSWLEEMIGYPTWRKLFYQLVEQYPDCLMLKFAMKLISDAGYQSEITSASTASHQPEVFSGLLRNALMQVTAARPAELQDSLRELSVSARIFRTCC